MAERKVEGAAPAPLRAAQAPDYVLVFDGGSKGNPGQGYGSFSITRSKDGAQRMQRLEFGDDCTNNEAEYDTLHGALIYLIGRIEAGARDPKEFCLEVRGDSQLVMEQLRGRWKVREPRMQERVNRILPLLRRFGSYVLKQQPRAESVRVLGH
jgi:ribonuclease HI